MNDHVTEHSVAVALCFMSFLCVSMRACVCAYFWDVILAEYRVNAGYMGMAVIWVCRRNLGSIHISGTSMYF